MIFLNSLLALGALAFTVPLAIHLLYRNRFEIVDWGAMRFLESVVRVNRRRMLLRNWLLLLLRCAIPILLALCLARPILTQFQTLAGDDPMSIVLAIDTSDSMREKVDANTTQFEQTIDAAVKIVQTLPRGSDVAIITSANVDGTESTSAMPAAMEPQSAISALRDLRPGGRALAIDAMVSESLRRASVGSTERRHVVVMTDHAASDFTQQQIDALGPIGVRRTAQQPSPTIAWMDPPTALKSDTTNRRITRLQPDPSAAASGQTVNWTVEARSDGDVPVTCDLVIRIDGKTVQTQTLNFVGSSARASFDTTFETAGRHAVEVALNPADEFPVDDSLRADFIVLPPVDVWLVDGNPTDVALQSDTDFVAIALSPFSLSGEKTVDLFRTRRVALGELTQQADAKPAIVVMADVAAPSDDAARWIADYVTRGGVLVLFAGPTTEPKFWDEKLLDAENRPLLPMGWGEVKSAGEDRPAWRIDESRLTYPPLAAVQREAAGTLETVEIDKYRELVARPNDRAAGDINEANKVNVVMRMDNGEALMTVARVDDGQIVQVATTANDRWTSLPRRLAFVPLMQRLFAHLATGETKTITATSGQPIKITPTEIANPETDGTDASDTETLPPETWQVTAPDGTAYPVTMTDEGLLWTQTDLSGVYQFASTSRRASFASVNVPDEELNRRIVNNDVVTDAAKRLGATRYAGVADYQTDDSNRRYGRGIWRYLLFALLAVLVLEPFVQQRGAKAAT